MMKYLIAIQALFFLLACNQQKSAPKLLEMNQMKVIVWQLMQVDEYYNLRYNSDSTWRIGKKNIQMYKQVFDLNKVSSADFYKTIDYLERHPVEFKRLLDSTQALTKRENKERIRPK